jgi:putative membrane protein
LTGLTEVLTGTERILSTPLPLAYTIAISQITWLYVLLLPFQLFPGLDWVTIPVTMVAAYIILGIAAIGREIENPFGNDVNDLPLEAYCDQLIAEIAIITSHKPIKFDAVADQQTNKMLYPLSNNGFDHWKQRSVDDIRAALKARAVIGAFSTTASQGNEALAGRPVRLDIPVQKVA